MKNPNPDMLLFIAQADACAVAVEFTQDTELTEEVLKFERYCEHPKYDLGAGQYTDDTQMSVANAEVLCLFDNPTPLYFANAWVECFHRDPRKGYAGGFQKFLERTRTGKDFLRDIRPWSEKNGAAMRSVPLGVLPNPDDVVDVATLQAEITHNTLVGRYGSIAVALMSHWALYHAEDNVLDFDELWSFVREHLPEQCVGLWDDVVDSPWEDNRRILSTTDTVNAVYHSILGADDMMEVLERIVRWGGDTDSCSAVAWGVASSLPWMKDSKSAEEIPEWMYKELEPNGQFGPQYLQDLGKSLMAKYS